MRIEENEGEAGKSLKVLLVEDEPAHARLVRELLRESKDLNFVVEQAEKLSQALVYLSRGSYDVVLLDLMLPDEKGLTTLERIHARAPDTAVVVLTVIDDVELALGAVRRGAQDYLVKKRLDVDVLVRTIRYAIERKRALERQGKLNLLFQNLGPDFLKNMEMIIETGRDILGGEHMNYTRKDRGGLFCLLSTAPGEELVLTGEREDHICSHVMASGGGDPFIIEDLRSSPFWESDPFVKKYQVKSAQGHPVLAKEAVVGSLVLFTSEQRSFTVEDMGIMAILARILGIEEERLTREEDLKDFIDIASHELRHPVTIIKGYAVSLKELWGKLDNNKRVELLDAIGQGTDRLNRLVMELLDVSRIERGHFAVRKRTVGLEPLLEKALGAVGGKSKGNVFTLSLSGGIPVLDVDPKKMLSALLNLLDNAVVYSPPGSEIELRAEASEGGVVVSVSDRGAGVPEEHRERIFERFGQVADALHHSSPGLGIGLYITREIAEAHGGRVWHEPREGGGSIFKLTIPVL